MDWLYVLMPIAGCKIFWPGFYIRFFRASAWASSAEFSESGGAWMVTPGLNILGLPWPSPSAPISLTWPANH